MRSSPTVHLGDLAVADAPLELAVGDRLAGLDGEEERLAEREQQQEPEHVPHRDAGPGRGGQLAVARPPAARVRGLAGRLIGHRV